jgi:hypothetical protein
MVDLRVSWNPGPFSAHSINTVVKYTNNSDTMLAFEERRQELEAVSLGGGVSREAGEAVLVAFTF